MTNDISQFCLCFGVPFRLSAETDTLLEQMKSIVPFGTHFVTGTGDPARQFTLSSTEAQLRSDLMTHIANEAPHRIFVHAGVVARNGRALLLPGTSYAGKTTLVAELVRAGAIYYSDEYAVLDEQGHVHPYARTLQMREPGGDTQTPIAVQTLNGIAGTAPIPISMVVFAEYLPHAPWSPQPVTPGLAVLEVLRHTIPLQRTPARVLATLSRVMETASAWRSQRGEANSVAAALLNMLDA